MKKVIIVTPAPPGSRKGNRITAIRWASILNQLGISTEIQNEYQNQTCDALIALHAYKSAASVEEFRQKHPQRPIILALTGTDLYHDIHVRDEAQDSLKLADKLILLQPLGLQKLKPEFHHKATVIFQSVSLPPEISEIKPSTDQFQVCVVGHLREVKDPLRAAYAVRSLPETSRIQIIQIGAILSKGMENCVQMENRINPRYHWMGELPREKILEMLAKSHLLVHSSLMEGGANVLSEAIAVGVPVLASDIPGNRGMLGADYPGYFPSSDTAALKELMLRAETDSKFYNLLKRKIMDKQPLIHPDRELNEWKKVLQEFKLL